MSFGEYLHNARDGLGMTLTDLWRSAGGIIADAEKTGKVDTDAALRRKARVNVKLAALPPCRRGAGGLIEVNTSPPVQTVGNSVNATARRHFPFLSNRISST